MVITGIALVGSGVLLAILKASEYTPNQKASDRTLYFIYLMILSGCIIAITGLAM